MSIDYRTLLVPAYDGPDGPFAANTIAAILASRIPALCPDCKGTGLVVEPTFAERPVCLCGHPKAPTIADLLRWGENVAKATVDDDYGAVRLGDQLLRASAVGLLAALRTEADR